MQPQADRAAGRFALLGRATALLSSPAPVDEALGDLARLLVPDLADWCAVSVVGRDGSIEQVAVAGAGTPDEGDEAAHHPENARPYDPDAPAGVAAAIRTGESALYREVDDDLLRRTALDDASYELAVSMGTRSGLIVPLQARGRTIGALSLLSAGADRYGDDDRAFAEQLGRWAGLTVDNARLVDDARRAGRRFRELVDNLEAVVWEAEADLPPRFTYVSNRAEALLGYPVQRWLEDPSWLLHVVAPEDREALVDRWKQVLAEPGRHILEYRVVTSDGRHRWVRDRVEAVEGDRGGTVRVLGLMVDVTAEKQATERLAAQYAITRALAQARRLDEALPAVLKAVCTTLGWSVGAFWEATTEGMLQHVAGWHADPAGAGAFIDASRRQRFRRGQGLPGRVWARAEPVWISDITVDGDFPRAEAAARSGLHSGVGFPVTSGGRVVGIMEFFNPEALEHDQALLDMLGSIGAQVGQFLERLRMNEQAAFRSALLKAQSDTGMEGQLVVAPDGRLLSCNRRFIEMWSMPAQVVESGDGDAALEVMRAQVVDPEAFVAAIRHLSSHPSEHERDEVRLRDGRVFERYGAPLVGEGGTYYGWAWYYRDVTEQRHAEQQIRDSRARFASLARTLQASLLPPGAPQIHGLDVATRYRAAGEGIDVGGDFYDVFSVREDRWGVVIGDVSGKGPAAAALTALTRYTVRAAAARALRPSEVLAELNDAILREGDDERFCTVAYLEVRVAPAWAGISLCSGGHPLPLVVRTDGAVQPLGRTGTLVGAFPTLGLADEAVGLQPGDAVVLYTDGVLEARSSPTELFGSHRLTATLAAHAGAPAATMADAVVSAVVEFGGEPRDDVAIVVLAVPPAG